MYYDDLNGSLGVSVSVAFQIITNPSYATEEKRRKATIAYYLGTIPLASWATLAGEFYRKERHVSLEAVRKYLRHSTG